MRRIDAPFDPGGTRVGRAFDQGEAVAVGACEAQPLLVEQLIGFDALGSGALQSLDPERQRAFRHGENGFADLAGARATAGDVDKDKISHHAAWQANLVAVIEVVDRGLVEIDRLLHPPETEGPREERVVDAGVRGQRRHVVQPLYLAQLVHRDLAKGIHRLPLLDIRFRWQSLVHVIDFGIIWG